MDSIPFQDFAKVDMRVGTIVEVLTPEGSEKLYRLRIDLGEELGIRTIFAGLKPYYPQEELLNKQVVVVVNLQPRSFFGEEGQGMLLAADGEKPYFLTPSSPTVKGAKIR